MAKEDYKGIWVFAEQQNGKLNSAVLEILAKSQELKAHTGEEITAVLLGSGVKDLAATLFEYGADNVIVAEDPALEKYSARPYQAALTQLSEKYKPSIILYGATSLGRDLAPRLMITLKTGLTADAIDAYANTLPPPEEPDDSFFSRRLWAPARHADAKTPDDPALLDGFYAVLFSAPDGERRFLAAPRTHDGNERVALEQRLSRMAKILLWERRNSLCVGQDSDTRPF